MSAHDDALLFAGNQLALMQSLRRLLDVSAPPRDSVTWDDYMAARREAQRLLNEMDSTDALAAYIEEAT